MIDDKALLEIVVRALCKSEGTAQCAAICLSHFSLNTTNGCCPEAMRVWGRKASAAIAAIDKVRAEGSIYKKVMCLIRDEYDRRPSHYAGDWNDNAEDVADKIISLCAAGLAKGRGEKAELREALKEAREWIALIADSKPRRSILTRIDAVLTEKV